VQLNDPVIDPLMQEYPQSYIANGMHLANMVIEVLGRIPLSISASPDVSALANKAAESLALMMTLDGIPVSYTNIRNHFDRSAGWSVRFFGESGQIRLCPNNQLDILEKNTWKTLLPARNSGKPVEIELLVGDFIQSCLSGKEPEPNSSNALIHLVLDQKAAASSRTGQVIHLFNEHDDN
jgi:hypothetical protein